MIPEATYENPHTFEEAKQYLAEGHHIDYEVRHQGQGGALLTREDWLRDVESKFFIDYDGMGNELDENGNFLGVVPHKRENGRIVENGDPGWISPSQAARIRPETKYILWYNR